MQDFHFGQTRPTDAWDAVHIFARMISTFHSHDRKVALVGHSLKPCMRILRAFGLDLTKSFDADMDTYDIAHDVFGCVGRPAFTDILEALNIKFAWLSCAGNYANYIIKALLALATYKWMDYPPIEEEMRVNVEHAIKIARNLVVSGQSTLFPENYSELPKSNRSPEKVNSRDCVTEKKIRNIRSQDRDWTPSWDEAMLSRVFRCSLLESGGVSWCS